MPRTLLPVGLTVLILGLALAESVILVHQSLAITVPEWELGQDYRFYVEAARRWLDTGSFYLPHQIAGPYSVTLMSDVLYPPSALYLFTPFIWLPWILWWLIPLATIGWIVFGLRPVTWSWPVLALILLWPRTLGAVVYGNTDMWAAAALAAAIRWGWPAALVALKPTLAFLMVPFIRDRRLWIGAAALTVASLPFATLWVDYLMAIQNVRIGWEYSLSNLPLVLLPLAAALAAGARWPQRGPGKAAAARAQAGIEVGAKASPSGAAMARRA